MTGLEPANGGTTNHCLNHLATLATDLYSSATTGVMATGILTFGQNLGDRQTFDRFGGIRF